VALHDGSQVIAESTTVDTRRHTELLMPQVVDVLAKAGADRRQLTEIAVGVGPGPFTGLRVGLAAARTMAAALGVPVRGVCSLDIVAHGTVAKSQPDGPFAVATDARRREVYWATYDATGQRTTGPHVGDAADITASTGGAALPAAGAGASLYPDAFAGTLAPEYPSAAYLASAVVAGAVPVGPADPMYLRRPDAVPQTVRKSVLT
jgi:tRNA threonylcarbamoyl adenosine modification protein YeaZ